MKRKQKKNPTRHRSGGFTLIELLIGSTIMAVIIIAALAVYSKSNQVSVDQQQFAEVQNDVRSAMYIVMRDTRMIGVGIPEAFRVNTFQGFDNEGTQEVKPDRLLLIGNMDWPMILPIQSVNGGATDVKVEDGTFERYPYPLDFYVCKIALVLPNPASGCVDMVFRVISSAQENTGGTQEHVNMSFGQAPDWNVPTNLKGDCLGHGGTDAFVGGSLIFVDVNEYWLDVTGNPNDQPKPELCTADNGYLGLPGVFYKTVNGFHNPIAQNVENFQVQYNGDFDADGTMDGFKDWDTNWALDIDQLKSIRQIRVQLLGRTPNAFVSVSGKPDDMIHLYRRPAMANTLPATTDDLHRRFLLESTSNIRNLSMTLYNQGER